jgi:hypothetical protein
MHLSHLWTRSSPSQSMVEITFMILGFRHLKYQTSLLSVLQSSGVNDLFPAVSLNLWLGSPLRIRPSGLSVLKSSPLLTGYLRSGRSADTYPPQSTVVLPLWDFGLLNQINGPTIPSSIDDRNLLRVFRPFPPPLFFQSSRYVAMCPPSHRRLSSFRIFGLRKSQMSNLAFLQ